jgi:hypothetical protein
MYEGTEHMSEEERLIGNAEGGYATRPPTVIGDGYFIPTAVEEPAVMMQLEVLEASSVQQEALLAQIRDHLISLRIDLGPMADYYKKIMQAAQAQAQDAEANRLPIGFPAAAKLEEAGYTAVSDVPRKSSTLRHLGLSDEEITAVLTQLAKGNQ